ncbi:hypothetical protein OXX59_005522 [Metschnikowia pulcherrima]
MSKMASKSAPSEAKAKKPRRKAKSKKFESLIDYGDPNTKVVVRLLPPTLEMKEFIKQAADHSSTFKSGYKSLTYRRGSQAAQAFEEPNFSLAFVKFHSPEAADSFRSEITGVSFSETSSGDNIKCSTAKSIFGEISAAAPASDSAIDSAVFSVFADLREKNEGHVDINRAIDAVKSRLKQQKVKLKSEKKKLEKAKTRSIKDGKSPKEESNRHLTDKDERSSVLSAPDDKSSDASSIKNKSSKLSQAEKKKNKNISSSKKAKQTKVEEQQATKTPGTTSKSKAPKKRQRAEKPSATSTPSV